MNIIYRLQMEACRMRTAMLNTKMRILRRHTDMMGCDAGEPDFFSDERGLGTIEIVLILVVLIGLVIVFKREISSLLNSIFDSVDTQAGTIYK